jgi:hypothetical protein
MPSKYTIEDVKEVFESKGYELLETSYKNNKHLMRYTCKNHPDKEQRIRFNDLTTGHGCKHCGQERTNDNLRHMARNQVKPFDEIKAEFNRRGYQVIASSYKGSGKYVQYKCPSHPDKILKIKYNDLKKGNGCRLCSIDAQRIGIKKAREEFVERGYTLLDNKYINAGTPMQYTCPKHSDKDTKISLTDLKAGHGCRYCAIERSRGNLSVHYNHDLPDEYRSRDRRYDAEIYAWRKEVYQHDGYTCVKCGDSRGGNLNAHHKDGFNWCKERRYDVSNGATLCEDCHRNFHRKYGYGDNTEQQFNEWLKEESE